MAGNESVSQESAAEAVYAFVAEQMQLGSDKFTISKQLVEKGMEQEDANHLVETVHAQLIEVAEQENLSTNHIVLAIAGGLIAAGLCGFAWGWMVIITGYEIGYAAVGLGLACGYGVVLVTGGKRGLPLQLVAVASSVLGIVVGKYITFWHVLKEYVEKEYGMEEAAGVVIFSQRVVMTFVDNVGSMLGGFDILWVVFAIAAAWRIPQGLGIKLPQ